MTGEKVIMRVHDFERLFRHAASLDVDNNDLKRVSSFLGRKMVDVLLMGQRNAKINGRDVIQETDLPITLALQQTMFEFEGMDMAPSLEPVLDNLVGLPPLNLEISEEVRALLPKLAGALVVATARVLKEIEPALKNPETDHWDRAERVLNHLI